MTDAGTSSFQQTMDALNRRYLIGVPGVREIWLIRHADAYGHAPGTTNDLADPGLSEVGALQARALAERLSGVSFDAIWTSPARRCGQTAEVLVTGRGLTVRTDPRLREVQTYRDLGSPSVLRPAGEYPFPEPQEAVVDRMNAAIGAILTGLPTRDRTPGRAVVVGHTAAMLIYISDVLDLAWGQLRTMLGLTSVSVIAYRDDRAVMRSFGDVSHLATQEYETSAHHG